jgi:hypothetical protein
MTRAQTSSRSVARAAMYSLLDAASSFRKAPKADSTAATAERPASMSVEACSSTSGSSAKAAWASKISASSPATGRMRSAMA